MSTIEIIAVLLGIWCVWLTIRQNIWCWPVGLVQVIFYIFIFYEAKLYSDVILQVIYVVLQIYGWYHWLHGHNDDESLPISKLGTTALGIWMGAVCLGTIAWGWIMATRTDAALPYGDAFTTVASLVAQWLLARKRLESWWVWITVDIVAIGIYYQKHLYMTSGLYAIFLCMATFGYFEWKRKYNSQPEVA